MVENMAFGSASILLLAGLLLRGAGEGALGR